MGFSIKHELNMSKEQRDQVAMVVLGERLGSEAHFEEGGSRCWVGVIVKGMNQEFGAVELCEELENSKDGGS